MGAWVFRIGGLFLILAAWFFALPLASPIFRIRG